MIHAEDRHKKIIKEILSKYPYTFYAFGSRVTGKHKQFSDLDLVYKDKIPPNIVSHIEEDFEESDLPFKVDIVDWNRCSDDFKKLIEESLVLLKHADA